MSFEWLISLRFLKAKRRQAFISLISIISMAGVALGVCALIVVLSVMNGMQKDMRDKIMGVQSHVIVLSGEGGLANAAKLAGEVEKLPGVTAATPYIYSQAMIAHEGRVSGVVIRGIDPASAAKASRLKESLLGRDLGVFTQNLVDPRPESAGQSLPPIVLGRELATNLGVMPGQVIRLITPYGRMTPAGRATETKDFVVADLLHTGLYEYDAGLVLLSIPAAQAFLHLGQSVTGLEVRLADIYAADQAAQTIRAKLGPPHLTRTWMELNRNLFAALKLEKAAMFIILVLIVLVAAFNIIATLIMIVMEKTKDIAILKAIGATNGAIRKIFIYQGLTIGGLGTTFGLALGLVLCELLRRYKFIHLPADVYYISTLPVRVEALDVALVAAISVAISFLATLYPSRQGARLAPTEALRYE